MSVGNTRLGCESLLESPPSWFHSARLGLLTNQASFSSGFEHVSDLIRRAGGQIRCLFSPQHGYFSEKQANMYESADDWNGGLSVPVFSLYGSVREPTEEMLRNIDILLIDLQDVGTRVYTYTTTMGLCIEAAGRMGLKVVVLDRPNPINGTQVEGNLVKEECRSFVGRYPVPMRHGLTMGEFARFIVNSCHVACDLEVIRLDGWERSRYFCDSRLHWFYPSPNIPTWETALLYPGMVLLEGTNVSEGRGTTLPFHVFGAPFIDQHALGKRLRDSGLEGVVFRPVCFEPVYDKWKGRLCFGFQIHVTDRERFRPYRLGLTLLRLMLELHEKESQWLPPPYEYEWNELPIDILLGDKRVREGLEKGESIEGIESSWMPSLSEYREKCENCFLYA